MKIVEVSFRANTSLGKYQHAHVEMKALVEPDENPIAALDRLKRLVIKELMRIKKETKQSDEQDY